MAESPDKRQPGRELAPDPTSGQSGGGAYPNNATHDSDKPGDNAPGGQSEQGYYGKGRLGGTKVDEEPDNGQSAQDRRENR
jgi:hypothetical protein